MQQTVQGMRFLGGTPVVTIYDANLRRDVFADARTHRPIRDAVTGAPIPADTTHVMKVRTERLDYTPPKRELSLLEDLGLIETTPIPGTITTAQVDDGRLGGKRYTPEFARYLGSRTASQIAADVEHQQRWWQTDYAQARIADGFATKYGRERGQNAYDAAMRYLRDGEAHATIASETGHTIAWVDRQVNLARLFAFRKTSGQKGASNPDQAA